ncbi:MAG: glycosyltransferase family 4 protein [Polyangiaceae bacterium]
MSERIAVVSTSYPRYAGDAAGHFVHSEVKRLVRAGHEVHVFAPGRGALHADGATLHWLDDHGAFGWPGALARLRERPARLLGAGAFCVRAERGLRERGPFQRLQAHFFLPAAWPIATRAFRREPRPTLELIGHGSDVRLFCKLPAVVRRSIARAWLARGARLRVTSAELATLLSDANPELARALRVEASPLDVDDIPTRAEARRALAIPESTRLALIVSRLVPGKRVDLALRALALLDGISTCVVGDGPELEALRGQFPAVHFAGRLPRPAALRYMAAADVVVSASAEEGAPSAVREARALGVPVIAVAAGDLASWAERDAGLLLVAR